MTDNERKALFLNLPPLIPVPTAARVLGLSRAQGYRCAEGGDLPSVRMGGRVYIVKEEIRHLVLGVAETQTNMATR